MILWYNRTRTFFSTLKILYFRLFISSAIFKKYPVLNILVAAFEIYFMFPYMLQGYYKWKYPEEYREWEGKSAEEWYGKSYLKKHAELLEKKIGN